MWVNTVIITGPSEDRIPPHPKKIKWSAPNKKTMTPRDSLSADEADIYKP